MSRRGVGRSREPVRGLAVGLRLVAAMAVVLAVLVPTAAAAGQTTVSLVPARSTVEVGESVTVDLVVADVDGGVGGFVAEVRLANPAVAAITDVAFAAEPALSDVVMATDGEAARFGAVIMNTSQAGSVTVATVTVRAREPGSTPVDLTVDPLADEQGNPYTVETAGTGLETTGGGTPVPPTGDDEPDYGDDELDLGGFGGNGDGSTPSPTAVPTVPSTMTTATSAGNRSASKETAAATAGGASPSPPPSAAPSDGASPARTAGPSEILPTPTAGADTPSGPVSSIPRSVQLGIVLLIGAVFAALVGLRMRR